MEAPSFGIWRSSGRSLLPRRVPSVADRCRAKRANTSGAILTVPLAGSMDVEVKAFKVNNMLRRTKTEVHNSLPTVDTIQTEKTLLSFSEKRRTCPDLALYGDFYRSLTSSITPLPSRVSTARTARPSARGPLDTPRTILFTLFPQLSPPHTSRPLPSAPSIVSRLVTSYGVSRDGLVTRGDRMDAEDSASDAAEPEKYEDQSCARPDAKQEGRAAEDGYSSDASHLMETGQSVRTVSRETYSLDTRQSPNTFSGGQRTDTAHSPETHRESSGNRLRRRNSPDINKGAFLRCIIHSLEKSNNRGYGANFRSSPRKQSGSCNQENTKEVPETSSTERNSQNMQHSTNRDRRRPGHQQVQERPVWESPKGLEWRPGTRQAPQEPAAGQRPETRQTSERPSRTWPTREMRQCQERPSRADFTLETRGRSPVRAGYTPENKQRVGRLSSRESRPSARESPDRPGGLTQLYRPLTRQAPGVFMGTGFRPTESRLSERPSTEGRAESEVTAENPHNGRESSWQTADGHSEFEDSEGFD